MAELNKSIRLSTTPGGEDKYISVKLEQEFDFLEVLSLKISQEDLYASFCANYGVVVGRAIANGGFGVPNAKVSVFIPITDEDERNELIRDLYPYRNVNDKDKNGVRYNLLLSESTCQLNKPVGTFPTKDTLLNNEIVIEIFDKYYRYTTKTNDAGDYMLFGVPVGNKIIHMDVDLSDIGFLSVRPYDLIAQGAPEGFFESKTQFKSSTNLDILPQIKTSNQSVDVIPFWGDPESCQIGITRLDFDIEGDITPNCVFMGSIFTDSDDNALKRNCRIKNDIGDISQLETSSGTIDILKLLLNNTATIGTDIEIVDSKSIDDDGTFLFTLPMYYDRVITNEFGEIVRSIDQTKGVPTKGKYRFKIKFDNEPTITNSSGTKSVATASLIIPSVDDYVRFSTDIDDYTQQPSETTVPAAIKETDVLKHFHTFEWKQVYTTSQYIRKLKREQIKRWGYIGLKDRKFIMTNPLDDDDGNEDDDDDVLETNTRLKIPYTTIIRRSGASFTKTKKIGLSFHDSWLNGGLYFFKFKLKKTSNNVITCCGKNNNNGNFLNGTFASYTLNSSTDRRCTFLTPVYTFAGGSDPNLISNKYNRTGANDTDEFVYCKWSLDTKIINISSMLMCDETLETIENSISNNPQDPVFKFTKGGNGINQPCLGTNLERGVRTEVLIDSLKPTTYLDLNEYFPFHVNKQSNWGNTLALNISGWFNNNNSTNYYAREIELGDGGHYIKYYCRLDYNGINNSGDVISFTPNPFNTNVLDSNLTSNFGCVANNQPNTLPPLYDKVYYYFGLIPGKTAIEKLKKDFFTF